MTNLIEYVATKYDLDDQVKKYAEKKASRLFKYIPKHAKKSASLKITMEELTKNRDDKFKVDLMLVLPEKTLLATGSGTSMMAAIDTADSKILSQIRRYKTEALPQLGSRSGLLRQMKQKFFRQDQ